MNSALAVRPDVATPTIQHLPPDVHSLDAATEAIEWGECYGLTLDPDQKATLYAALGERIDGSWAAGEVGDAKGRQAGKNDTVKVRQGAGVDLFGERLILHTAHEFSTANEDFLRLVTVYENYDELRAKVSRIRYANGEQGIEFLSGARIKYRARTGGAGRGFAEADLVIYDEMQHLQAEQLAASMPTLLANPNFQAWFCGSGGMMFSSQSWALRRRAISGNGGRLAYTENSAQLVRCTADGEIVCENPPEHRLLDDDVLRVHPGYANGRVSLEAMTTMRNAMGPALFAREILCCWEPEPTDGVVGPISQEAWGKLAKAKTETSIESNRCWALAVSPDRQWSALGVAGRNADGKLHVEWRDHEAGAAWVVNRCVEAFAKLKLPIRIHKSGPEAAFIGPLRERGVGVVEVSTAELAQSTGQLIDAANAGMLVHLGQPSLDKALRGAVLRMSSDGASVWSQRSSSVEITPLVAVTVALGGVPETSAALTFAY